MTLALYPSSHSSAGKTHQCATEKNNISMQIRMFCIELADVKVELVESDIVASSSLSLSALFSLAWKITFMTRPCQNVMNTTPFIVRNFANG
mmetsp:Transcript_3192/g.5131  ORF Transcript_3192/g.5131 Transcript_3192/m.5131 type:complete len:92 (-) Transcript_3192:995-1270(-)